MKQFLKKSALAMAALACAVGAHAVTLDFDNGVDTTYAAGAPFILQDRDAVIQNGYVIGVDNATNAGAASDESLVGTLFDPSINSCDSATLTCPAGNSTIYLAAFKGGLLFVRALDGSAFCLSSFSAGFIGTPGNTNTQVSGVAAGLCFVQRHIDGHTARDRRCAAAQAGPPDLVARGHQVSPDDHGFRHPG